MDGNLDILLVGSKVALYQGDGKGHFTDVSDQTGISKLKGHFLGCAVGDYDNDGWPDIYLTGYRGGLLLHNENGKFFHDVTNSSRIPPQPWGTSAAWIQTRPETGLLDLYVCNYCDFSPASKQLCPDHGILSSCGPRYYSPIPNKLYRNQGDGTFLDVTHLSNAGATGRALGIACADYDNSGTISIALANDEEPGNLLHAKSRGGRTDYTDIAVEAGTAFDGNGNVHGGMGTNWGDYDNDGKLDLLVATFYNEEKSLYHNDGNGTFTDVSMMSGVGAYGMQYVTFGACFLDANNNGWLDIILCNGHVQDNIHKIDPALTYREPTIFLTNSGIPPLYYSDTSDKAGFTALPPIVGRGIAVGDYDNDGLPDLLVVDSQGSPVLLHNESYKTGHWLGVRLEGVGSNRDGYGAMLTAEFDGKKVLRHCHADGSYMSSSDSRIIFGLGISTKIERLTVKWPNGDSQTHTDLPIDRYITIKEGDIKLA